MNSTLMNATNPIDLTADECLIATIILELVAFLGSFLNGTAVLLTFATDLRKQNINIFFGNMAIADFATSFIFFVGQPYVMLNPANWNTEYCKWLGFVQFLVAFETVTFIPYLSVNRYVRLCHNHLYHRIYSKRGINIMVCISWLMVFLVVIPYKFGGLTGFDQENLHCCIKYAKDVFWDAYYLSFTFAPIVFCDGVALFASFKVYQKMKQQVAGMAEVRNISCFKEVQLYTILDVLIPVLLLLPYFVIKYTFADRSVLWVRIAMPCLFLSCPVLRGFNVLIVLRPYKRALMKALGCKKAFAKSTSIRMTLGTMRTGASAQVVRMRNSSIRPS